MFENLQGVLYKQANHPFDREQHYPADPWWKLFILFIWECVTSSIICVGWKNYVDTVYLAHREEHAREVVLFAIYFSQIQIWVWEKHLYLPFSSPLIFLFELPSTQEVGPTYPLWPDIKLA